VAPVLEGCDVMRAAYIERLGPPEEILFGELPEPEPGPGEVLVEVAATTANPVDTFVRSGLYRTPVDFPFVIGRDLVGTVLSTGSDVDGFGTGDPVWCNSMGHGGRQGAAAERIAVPADRLYPLPDDVSEDEAVAVVHPAATAYLGLFTHGHLSPGETVLISGAAGNVGGAMVVLAARAGARVLATAAERDADHCRALGAAEVLDYRDPKLVHRILELCPDGVDVHLDTSGTNDLRAAVELIGFRGRIVVLAGARSEPVLPAGSLYLKDGSLAGFVISRATCDELADAAEAINGHLAAGLLRPKSLETRPLSAARETHQRLENGELHGRRVVLRPDLDD
jgi:NADPH:quinone reductase-like Zn-dependent oxidoreductase